MNIVSYIDPFISARQRLRTKTKQHMLSDVCKD